MTMTVMAMIYDGDDDDDLDSGAPADDGDDADDERLSSKDLIKSFDEWLNAGF